MSTSGYLPKGSCGCLGVRGCLPFQLKWGRVQPPSPRSWCAFKGPCIWVCRNIAKGCTSAAQSAHQVSIKPPQQPVRPLPPLPLLTASFVFDFNFGFFFFFFSFFLGGVLLFFLFFGIFSFSFSFFIFVMYQTFSNVLSIEMHKVSVHFLFSLFSDSRHRALYQDQEYKVMTPHLHTLESDRHRKSRYLSPHPAPICFPWEKNV